MTTLTPETHTIRLRDGNELDIQGTRIGHASSAGDDEPHTNHPGEPFGMPGTRCRACRWIELSIYLVDAVYGVYTPDTETAENETAEAPQGRYLVHKLGQSIVPGEIIKVNLYWTDKAIDVVKSLLYQGRLDGANRLVAARAAQNDPEIYKALQVW